MLLTAAGWAEGREILDVDGCRVVVHSAGVGMTTYVLVPGLGMTQRYFVPLANELATGGVVHSVHLPDVGRTRGPVSIAALAETTWGALARLGVERPVLVGHSMGSQVVVEMAARHPARSRAVVLLAPVANPAERSGWQQAVRLWSGVGTETPRSSWIVVADSARCGVTALVRRLQALLAYPMEERIAAVEQPVLIIRGERDPLVPRWWAEELVRCAGRARLVEVPDEGHITMFRSSSVVARAITAVAGSTPRWPSDRLPA